MLKIKPLFRSLPKVPMLYQANETGCQNRQQNQQDDEAHNMHSNIEGHSDRMQEPQG